jgi:hypothetical protein
VEAAEKREQHEARGERKAKPKKNKKFMLNKFRVRQNVIKEKSLCKSF